ncbi:SDR family oxidoreductase [Aquirhabdus sp.]|uniref:SDR family oxidoreductase n=1 Tax=Aquirhabdus sp. TaxID=2824160 RepID=UPI00396C91E0
MKQAFVTGSTGLLGNNLVRMLIEQGVSVKALARSKAKAEKQFAGLPVEIIEGDMTNIRDFEYALVGCDALFHTAAYFRDNYKGGKHWQELYDINVEGTAKLLQAAYDAGIRRAVHTSSIAVLNGSRGELIDETMVRDQDNADDYYRSKILADAEVLKFLQTHQDMFIAMVLPGWMFGPGDVGPTSSGQFVMDFVKGKLPGIVPGSFSIVDARDVAAFQIAAIQHGRSGERYLAAGQHMTMATLFPLVAEASGVKAPTKQIPLFLLKIIAFFNELYASLTGKPVLLSQATVKLIVQEENRTNFDHKKSFQELGVKFRPIIDTLSTVVQWYETHGFLPARKQ